ncbi:MAG: diaminopimelate decarboxylase [Gemmatimonadetes bacterium]|nr:diaminopimelate decarboxylase [Gemmatimonadota bacterium]
MGESLLTPARPPFPRLGGVLHCGPLALDDLAEEHGTPLYVYHGDRALERLRTLRAAFGEGPPGPINPGLLVAYSVKANPNLALLRLFAWAGAGADIVSGGDLYCALTAGFPPERIVFAGVGKTRDEMCYGLEAGIRSFHVESAQELEVLAEVAAELGRPAPLAIRINPDVHSPTHEFTRTGHAAAKFGVSPDEAFALYARARAHPMLRPVGVDVHIGSQLREGGPFLRALDVMLAVAGRVRAELGIELEYADLGGGFGIADAEAGELDVRALGREVASRLRGSALGLIVEPGRFLVGDAGVLVTRVLYLKRSGGKTFVVTDAGMTELIRPSHYGGVHEVTPVRDDGHGGVEVVDVVGPVCEQGDFLARERRLPLPSPGALLCVHQAGAYGFTMASNYNSRPRPAEVLVHDGRATLVRRRERYSDLIRGELG